jgi:outer membrane protein assembly factor BamE (lipoprotein component of BamABCDE complex)
MAPRKAPLPATLSLLAALALAGCQSTQTQPAASTSSTTAQAPAAKPAAAPAPAAASKTPPGMNDRGEVVDSSKVEGGHGQKVKGMGGWEGEITGKPAAGTKFTRLQIGMSRQQVLDIVGQPTDQGAYVTGKAWIPFYFGSDRYRHELAYKGQGRLIFAGSGGFDTNAHLIWIIHNGNDSGYR